MSDPKDNLSCENLAKDALRQHPVQENQDFLDTVGQALGISDRFEAPASTVAAFNNAPLLNSNTCRTRLTGESGQRWDEDMVAKLAERLAASGVVASKPHVAFSETPSDMFGDFIESKPLGRTIDARIENELSKIDGGGRSGGRGGGRSL